MEPNSKSGKICHRPKILINYGMKQRRSAWSYDECLERIVSPVQREVFLIIDQWWKKFGFSPSLRDIARVRGVGLSTTKKTVDALVELGVIKRLDKTVRSIRPVYLNFKNLD